MADNYLENKMEQHRTRAGAPVRRRSPLGMKPGTAVFAFGERNIVVTGVAAAPGLAAAVIKALGATGSHVAFLWDDMAAGQRLAQATSTRHYPWPDSRAGEVRCAFGEVDFEAEVRPGSVVVSFPGGRTEIAGADASAVSEAAVYALLPITRRLGLTRLEV